MLPRRVLNALLMGFLLLALLPATASQAGAGTDSFQPLVRAAQPVDSEQATLTVLEGGVRVIAGNSGSAHDGFSGETLHAGDRLLTGTPGRGLVTFFNGSELETEAGTEILIQDLGQTSGGGVLLQIAQASGVTINRVAQLGNDSSYVLITPNTTALVRGTLFTARITQDPQSGRVLEEELAVDEGEVEVRLRTETRRVQPGERLKVVPVGGGLTTVAQEPAVLGGASAPIGPFDLNGLWVEESNNLEVRIVHQGTQVLGTYIQTGRCAPADANAEPATTTFAFAADVAESELRGHKTSCRYSPSDPTFSAIYEAELQLTIGPDGQTLEGFWLDENGSQHPIRFLRAVPIDLNGTWRDAFGITFQIVQNGNQVVATWTEPFVCDHRDGSGQVDETNDAFHAALVGRDLIGEYTLCVFGFADGQNGFRTAPFFLRISPDASTLQGFWIDPDGNSHDETYTRAP